MRNLIVALFSILKAWRRALLHSLKEELTFEPLLKTQIKFTTLLSAMTRRPS